MKLLDQKHKNNIKLKEDDLTKTKDKFEVLKFESDDLKSALKEI